MEYEKVFFTPGDIVMLKQDIPDAPLMIVKSIDKATIKTDREKPVLFGVTCFWFTTSLQYQENRFNTKDLKHKEQ